MSSAANDSRRYCSSPSGLKGQAARWASANPGSNVTVGLHGWQFFVSISCSELHPRQGSDIFDGAVEIAHHDDLLGVASLQVLDVVGRQGLDLFGGLLDRPECVASKGRVFPNEHLLCLFESRLVQRFHGLGVGENDGQIADLV